MLSSSKSETEEFNYLVLDIDCCALIDLITVLKKGKTKNVPNPREDLLSPAVVEEGRKTVNGKRKYAGFYICTFRYSATIFTATFSDKVLGIYKKSLQRKYDPTHLLTHCVVQNLEKALEIPCVGISTLDDLSKTTPKELHLQCGYGYEIFVKPMEQKLLELNQKKIAKRSYLKYQATPIPEHKNHEPYQKSTLDKNSQLRQISYHASSRHSSNQVHLEFWDNTESHCLNASALEPENLPCNVSLQATQHDAYLNILKLVGNRIQGLAKIQSSKPLVNSIQLICNKLSLEPSQVYSTGPSESSHSQKEEAKLVLTENMNTAEVASLNTSNFKDHESLQCIIL